MKREGRQHGSVQTHPIISSPWNPRRTSNRMESASSTAGIFTKVPRKPTNHSKFTGKCGRPRCASCHIHPASKAKDKTKGTHKLKSCDVVTNYRLVTWRVVDARPGLNLTGFSATGILDHLANDYGGDDIDGDEIYHGYDDNDDVVYDSDDPPHPPAAADWIVDSATIASASNIFAIEELDDDIDDDGKMSFCDVDFEWEQVEGDDETEGWCLVEEI